MKRKFLIGFMKGCSFIQLFSLIGLVAALIVWLVFNWSLAWKIGLTSIVFFILSFVIFNGIKAHLK